MGSPVQLHQCWLGLGCCAIQYHLLLTFVEDSQVLGLIGVKAGWLHICISKTVGNAAKDRQPNPTKILMWRCPYWCFLFLLISKHKKQLGQSCGLKSTKSFLPTTILHSCSCSLRRFGYFGVTLFEGGPQCKLHSLHPQVISLTIVNLEPLLLSLTVKSSEVDSVHRGSI